MASTFPRRRRFPWFEVIILIGLAIIFGVTYWQYKGAQHDLQKHLQETQEPPVPK
jgi:hypothetical protein